MFVVYIEGMCVTIIGPFTEETHAEDWLRSKGWKRGHLGNWYRFDGDDEASVIPLTNP